MKVATSVDVQNRTSPDTDYSYGLKPENIPLTISEDADQNTVVPESIEVRESFTGYKSTFKIGLLNTFKDWLYARLVPITLGVNGNYLAKGTGDTLEWKTLEDYAVIPDGAITDLVLGDKTLGDKFITLGVEGGTVGQALIKDSSTTGEYSWATLNFDIAGGTTGQVLKKNSATDGDYSFADESVANVYTFTDDGTTNSVISPNTAGNDFKTKGIGKDVLSTSDKLSLSATSNDVLIKLDNPEGDDLLVVNSNVSWGVGGAPALDTFYGWIQHLENSSGIFLGERVVVNQLNVATTLGGVIDSTKEYFLDGNIDMSTIQIDLSGNKDLNLKGYDFNISGLFSTEDNYTMIIGADAGDLLWSDFKVEVSGSNSKVLDLTDSTGFHAFEIARINFNNCTSRGILNGYRQGLETGTGYFGGTPELTLDGTWVGGYFIDTSIVRGLTDGVYSLFKAGATFLMSSRFRSNQNIDLPSLARFFDFAPANFVNPSTVQVTGAIVSRDGVFDATDTNITPNLNAGNLVSNWSNNNGMMNTFEGGSIGITTEAVTTINTQNVFETLNAALWTSQDLQHFDNPANGELRHLGNTPREYKIVADFLLASSSNDVLTLRVTKWDDSAAAFVTVLDQTRQVNNFQGGRDIAFFNVNVNTDLDFNDYILLEVTNQTSSDNITAELDSYYTVERR